MAHSGQPALPAFALLLPNRFLAAFISEQGFFELQQHVIWDVGVAERDGQTVAEFLFTESRQIAFAAITRATVVGVTVLFEFRRYRAVVVSATQQALFAGETARQRWFHPHSSASMNGRIVSRSIF